MFLPSCYINYKKVFELVLTGDNTKNKKYKKYSNTVKVKIMQFFLKNAEVSRKSQRFF